VNAMQRPADRCFSSVSKAGAVIDFRHASAIVGECLERLHLKLTAMHGTCPKGAAPLKSLRAALYKPYIASIDEGWTRFCAGAVRLQTSRH